MPICSGLWSISTMNQLRPSAHSWAVSPATAMEFSDQPHPEHGRHVAMSEGGSSNHKATWSRAWVWTVPSMKAELSLPREIEEYWEVKRWLCTTHHILNYPEQTTLSFWEQFWLSQSLRRNFSGNDDCVEDWVCLDLKPLRKLQDLWATIKYLIKYFSRCYVFTMYH